MSPEPLGGPVAAIRRVAILRALQLGDLLCTVPALRALRAALPDAEVTLVGLPWAAEFVRRYPMYLDRFVEFPGYPGLPEREPEIAAVPAFLAGMQGERYDLVLQMQGNGRIVNPLVALFGARRTAGFTSDGSYTPDPAWYLPYPDAGHEIHRQLALITWLHAAGHGDALEFPVWDADREELATVLPPTLAGRAYACLHPGARDEARRWDAASFAAVGDALAAEGLQMVLTGSAAERPLVAAVRDRMRAPSVDLAGRTTLGALAALLGDARLLVCNDTGVSHVAAALHVPSVVLFSASDPARWAPLDARLHRPVDAHAHDAVSLALAEARTLLGRGAARVA